MKHRQSASSLASTISSQRELILVPSPPVPPPFFSLPLSLSRARCALTLSRALSLCPVRAMLCVVAGAPGWKIRWRGVTRLQTNTRSSGPRGRRTSNRRCVVRVAWVATGPQFMPRHVPIVPRGQHVPRQICFVPRCHFVPRQFAFVPRGQQVP